MPNTIQRLRRHAFQSQGGRCYYCHALMWLTDPTDFIERFQLNSNQAGRHQCSAKHLVARCDGGQDAAENIVAACLVCNVRRHRMSPAPRSDSLARIVRVQIAAQQWHRKAAYRLVIAPAEASI